MLLYLHLRNSKIFFHPAKFENFKNETILDYKTVSVRQSQILAALKTLGLVGLWATFEGSFLCFGGQKKKFKFFFKNISATALKSYTKWLLYIYFFFGLNFSYTVLYPFYLVNNIAFSGLYAFVCKKKLIYKYWFPGSIQSLKTCRSQNAAIVRLQHANVAKHVWYPDVIAAN